MGLKQLANRNASFLCQMVVFDPEGQEHLLTVSSRARSRRTKWAATALDTTVFFIPEGETKTLAELGIAYKNKVSHRSQATNKLLELLTTKLV